MSLSTSPPTDEPRQLHEAIDSRDAIGQAKGILMERHRITGPQAFIVLSIASQHTHLKLWSVADYLINSGELPDRDTTH
ncbi:ANTAR domain-containing protein [Arthrobacter antioxidans]|uniref:ANTAR domain-containing protein n=1 Tax=Arthrobacter antioxidans TaxID=2895818 RepID=UPI0022A952EF|nr:ANTAR domain-containing protein [Arthrobacter antioxidans]